MFHIETQATEEQKGSTAKKQELVCMVEVKNQTKEIRFDLSLPKSASVFSTRVLQKENIKLIIDESYRDSSGIVSEIKVQLPGRSMQSTMYYNENQNHELIALGNKVKSCKFEKSTIEEVMESAILKVRSATTPAVAKEDAQRYDGSLFATNAISGKWDFLYPDGFLSNSKTTETATTPQSTK